MTQELLRISEKRFRNSHMLDIVIPNWANFPFLEQEDLGVGDCHQDRGVSGNDELAAQARPIFEEREQRDNMAR